MLKKSCGDSYILTLKSIKLFLDETLLDNKYWQIARHKRRFL